MKSINETINQNKGKKGCGGGKSIKSEKPSSWWGCWNIAYNVLVHNPFYSSWWKNMVEDGWPQWYLVCFMCVLTAEKIDLIL